MKIKRFKIFNFFNSYMKLSQKIIVFATIISIIPIVSLSLFFYNKTEQSIYNEVNISYNQILNQYIENINYKLNLYNSLINNIAFNSIMQNTFDKEDKHDFSQDMDIISKASFQIDLLSMDRYNDEIKNITIYPMDESYFYYQSHIGNISMIREEEWYKNFTLGKLNSDSGISYFIEPNSDTINLVRTIPNLKYNTYKSTIGIIKLDMDKNKLFEINNESINSKNQYIYIMDEKNKIIFSTDAECKVSTVFPSINVKNRKKYIVLYNKQGIMVNSTINGYKYKCIMFFKSSELQKKIKDAKNSILMISIFAYLCVIFIIVVFSKSFYKRVTRLMKKIDKVKCGNLEINETIEGTDEIAMIDKEFNDMIFKLNELIKENYIEKIEKKEAQLNALQSQINPHFLYNTLESINSMASVYGCLEICSVSQKLGDIFRYNINSGKNEFVKLIDEINHIKDFEYIQKVRYDDKIIVNYNIQEEMFDYKILKFILQPIVENSFCHGFPDKKPKGTIEIFGNLNDNTLVIQIKDDGIGISEEKLQFLNKYINESNDNMLTNGKGSIGLKNVNSRIKLCFGETYGVMIESKVNLGTTVTIILPAELYM